MSGSAMLEKSRKPQPVDFKGVFKVGTAPAISIAQQE
jgi:hypothetical protein